MLKISIYLRTARTLVYLLDACKKNNVRVQGQDGMMDYFWVKLFKKNVQKLKWFEEVAKWLSDFKEKSFKPCDLLVHVNVTVKFKRRYFFMYTWNFL